MCKKEYFVNMIKGLLEALSDQREKKASLSSMKKCTDFQEAHKIILSRLEHIFTLGVQEDLRESSTNLLIVS